MPHATLKSLQNIFSSKHPLRTVYGVPNCLILPVFGPETPQKRSEHDFRETTIAMFCTVSKK